MHTFQVAVFVSDGLGSFKGEYEVLDDMASKVEAGSANLYFIPHFAGRTCPSVPSVKGAFMGLDWKHGDAHMYRAVMESIAYEYSLYYDILNEHGATASVIHGAGEDPKVMFSIL